MRALSWRHNITLIKMLCLLIWSAEGGLNDVEQSRVNVIAALVEALSAKSFNKRASLGYIKLRWQDPYYCCCRRCACREGLPCPPSTYAFHAELNSLVQSLSLESLNQDSLGNQ